MGFVLVRAVFSGKLKSDNRRIPAPDKRFWIISNVRQNSTRSLSSTRLPKSWPTAGVSTTASRILRARAKMRQKTSCREAGAGKY
jgi:hypothetical protein